MLQHPFRISQIDHGLIAGKEAPTRLRRMLEMFSLYVGEDVAIDEPVYKSESTTGHRNRAIGHMLRNFDILTEPPDPVVDLYFKQCSVSVNCRNLGVMAATLANHGVNPITGRQAIRGEYVESVLSVMGSCGMYDYAGEWLYRVGMPAKSGVAGGVIAVLPGQLGIGVFSPPLDSHGNSVRGLKVCDDLSRHFDLHLFNTPHASKSRRSIGPRQVPHQKGTGQVGPRVEPTAASARSHRAAWTVTPECATRPGTRVALNLAKRPTAKSGPSSPSAQGSTCRTIPF